MKGWFERLFELFPGIRFEVEDVLVKGWPWRTRAVALVDVATAVAGEPYRNEVAQTIQLRWGRITRSARSRTRRSSPARWAAGARPARARRLEPAIVD